MLSADAVDNDVSEKCELCDLMNLDEFGLWRPKQALAVYRRHGEPEVNVPDSAAYLPAVTDLARWQLRESLTIRPPRNHGLMLCRPVYREYITTVIIIRDYIRFARLLWDIDAAHPGSYGHTCSTPTAEALDFDQSIDAEEAQYFRESVLLRLPAPSESS